MRPFLQKTKAPKDFRWMQVCKLGRDADRVPELLFRWAFQARRRVGLKCEDSQVGINSFKRLNTIPRASSCKQGKLTALLTLMCDSRVVTWRIYPSMTDK